MPPALNRNRVRRRLKSIRNTISLVHICGARSILGTFRPRVTQPPTYEERMMLADSVYEQWARWDYLQLRSLVTKPKDVALTTPNPVVLVLILAIRSSTACRPWGVEQAYKIPRPVRQQRDALLVKGRRTFRMRRRGRREQMISVSRE